VSGTARRAIGNYQEGVVIVRVLDDGSYQIETQVECPYGSEWPVGPQYDLSPLVPVVRELLIEILGHDPAEPAPDRSPN
jgi:hypothetical protein